MNSAAAPAAEKTIEIMFHPNIRSTHATPRPKTMPLVRETKTLVVVRSTSGAEIRISKTTGREIGVDRFAAHHALPKK